MKIIVNPKSNSGKSKKMWRFWQAHLPNHEAIIISQNDNIDEMTRNSSSDVVAVGGDGTINRVINGILKSGNNNSLGVLYSGTSPDFCLFNNIPLSPQKALNCLLENNKHLIDIIKINQDYAACSINIGLGANVADYANRWRKYFGDKLGTALGVIKAIISMNPFKCNFEIDNESFIFKDVNHIFVVKNPYIASGLKLNLDLKPSDGKMFVVIMHGFSRISLLKNINSLYKGDIVKHPNLFIKECLDIEILPECIQKLEFDGDSYPSSNIYKIKLLPKKLSLIGALR